MTRKDFTLPLFTLVVLSLVAAGMAAYRSNRHSIHATPIPLAAPIPAPAPLLTKEFTAAIDVARVFGRSTGCAEADPKLIVTVADEAVKAEVDPRVLAATIAVESACSSFAVSSHGSIGLMQVHPKTWRSKYDFEHQYNLLNTQDNLHVGTLILASLIKQWGLVDGLRHYNGMDTASDAYDADYSAKIRQLAGR